LLSFALFSVVSVRERRAFHASRPGTTLMAALAADAVAGVLVGLVGLGELSAMPAGQIALLYGCAAALVLGPNDWGKVVLTRRVGAAGAAASARTSAPPPDPPRQRTDRRDRGEQRQLDATQVAEHALGGLAGEPSEAADRRGPHHGAQHVECGE